MNHPAASDDTDFVWPYKPTEGPMGDCYENVQEFQRLNNAVARTSIEYVAELVPGYIEQSDAEIVADSVLYLEDVR